MRYSYIPYQKPHEQIRIENAVKSIGPLARKTLAPMHNPVIHIGVRSLQLVNKKLNPFYGLPAYMRACHAMVLRRRYRRF